MSMSSTKYGITTKDLIGQSLLYLLTLQYCADHPIYSGKREWADPDVLASDA
jgi:hypothetical protein